MTSQWGVTPRFGGAQTPMVGSMTPMHGMSSGRTPMYGSQTPQHGDGQSISMYIKDNVMYLHCKPPKGIPVYLQTSVTI